MNEEEKTLIAENTDNTENAAEESIGSDDNAARRMEELISENRELRLRLICAGKGIPQEIAEDILMIAEAQAAKSGISAEEAVEAAWERISGLRERIIPGAKEPPVTTGAAVKKSRAGIDPLRAAFGIKG